MKAQYKNITLLHLIRFFSSLYFYQHVITLFFLGRGLNYFQISTLFSIISFSQILTEVPTGIIADKVGRKFSIIAALFFQLIGEIIFVFADTYFLFVISSIIVGIGFSFFSGSFEAMIYHSLKSYKKEDQIQKVMGLNISFSQAAIVIGSFVGTFISTNLKISNFVLLIIMTACSITMAIITGFLLQETGSELRYSRQNSIDILRDGLKLIKFNKLLQRIILLSLFASPFMHLLLNFYQPYFLLAGVPGIWFGFALSIASVLGILISKYAYLFERRFGVKFGLFLAVLLPGIFYVLMAFILNSWISIIIFILAFSSMNIQKPLFVDYINRHIESKNRATILSFINMLTGLYIALMCLIIGKIADISLLFSFIFIGVIIIFSAFFLQVSEKNEGKNNNKTKRTILFHFFRF